MPKPVTHHWHSAAKGWGKYAQDFVDPQLSMYATAVGMQLDS